MDHARTNEISFSLLKCLSVSQVPEYAVIEKTLDKDDDGPCPICMCQLSEKSGYDDEGGGVGVEMRPIPYAPPVDLCKLRKCGHMMHRPCLLMMLKSESTKNGLTCPTCKKVYGTKTGDMPDGSMTVRHTRGSLPGHEGSGTIEIVYNFSPGVHNGRHYRANGFPRTCYLPDTEKGRKVLRLLQVAWERRLTFTIGTSVTTGATDTVVWNEIHHKTESSSNHSGHGYPDPNYLDNVLMELSLQGVTESDSEPATSDESL
jgi:deltex-like protein